MPRYGEASRCRATLNGFPIHYTKENKRCSKFEVVLSPTESITISTMKDIVSVNINGGTRKHFGGSVGIMGYFQGELKMRDGSVVSSFEQANCNKVGMEWQVKEEDPMLYQSTRAPQAPMEACRMPHKVESEQLRKLAASTVSEEAAEEACAHLTGKAHKACVFDVMTLGDTEMDDAAVY